MKSLLILSILILHIKGFSQLAIPSWHLSVSTRLTTNLIFPYNIKKADIGLAEVVGQKDEKMENVLFIKATRKDFPTTNLSVYTIDGKFYSFILKYKDQPDTLNLSFSTVGSIYPTDTPTAAGLDSDATSIDGQHPFIYKKFREQDMKAVLKGVYLKDHLMWFKLEITNHSGIDYQPAYIKFFIRDKRIAKRTAVQESESTPVWITKSGIIPGHRKATIIAAFSPFTISRQKQLFIETSDQNGERTLVLRINSKTILLSRLID